MTTYSTRNKKTLGNRFGTLALAFALSAGTVGGMVSFASLSQPAQARGNGGSSEGGAGATVMKPDAAVLDEKPNGRRAIPENCNGSKDMPGVQKCRYTQPRTVRVVNIHGFANCAVVQQMANGAFYCARAM
jgi:hypothetical protein